MGDLDYSWDALVLTRGCFGLLLVLKTIFYGLVAVQIRKHLGPKQISVFLKHYTHSQYLVAAAWRLGVFLSFFLTYLGLVVFIRIKDVKSPVELQSPFAWLWALLLVLLVVRTALQTLGEAIDLESSLKSLKRTLQLKAGLRHMGRVVSLAGFVYPLFAFQGWTALALWSKRAVIMGRGVALFEKWFDRRVYGELKQFVLTSAGASILGTSLRLLIIGLATFQSQFVSW